ncbi:hypothetical protein [Actinosynnema sp. ALI-1.44]|uniref:hypothetical protein n=1 Tax=Actinosynnema sp. ALI-1.44 TaxID=1933779 RepID=UPI00117761F8|nr:hypothetical protein [Actinosynnema sp. ALI-1.44]
MKQQKYVLALLVAVALAGVAPSAEGGQAENALGRFEQQRIARCSSWTTLTSRTPSSAPRSG